MLKSSITKPEASMVESSYGVGKLKGREEGRREGRKEAKFEVAISLFDILDDATIAKKQACL